MISFDRLFSIDNRSWAKKIMCFIIFLLLPLQLLADCAPDDIGASLKDSNQIFIGEVVKIEQESSLFPPKYPPTGGQPNNLKVTFKALKKLKGTADSLEAQAGGCSRAPDFNVLYLITESGPSNQQALWHPIVQSEFDKDLSYFIAKHPPLPPPPPFVPQTLKIDIAKKAFLGGQEVRFSVTCSREGVMDFDVELGTARSQYSPVTGEPLTGECPKTTYTFIAPNDEANKWRIRANFQPRGVVTQFFTEEFTTEVDPKKPRKALQLPIHSAREETEVKKMNIFGRSASVTDFSFKYKKKTYRPGDKFRFSVQCPPDSKNKIKLAVDFENQAFSGDSLILDCPNTTVEMNFPNNRNGTYNFALNPLEMPHIGKNEKVKVGDSKKPSGPLEKLELNWQVVKESKK